jgi:hypothetical protein
MKHARIHDANICNRIRRLYALLQLSLGINLLPIRGSDDATGRGKYPNSFKGVY